MKKIILLLLCVIFVSCKGKQEEIKEDKPEDIARRFAEAMYNGKTEDMCTHYCQENQDLLGFFDMSVDEDSSDDNTLEEEQARIEKYTIKEVEIREQTDSTANVTIHYADFSLPLNLISEIGIWKIFDNEMKDRPEIVAVKFIELMNKDLDKAATLYGSESTKELLLMAVLSSGFGGGIKKDPNKQGLHSVKAKQISMTEKKAKVRVSYKNNMDVDYSEDMDLIKEKGNWKIHMEKKRGRGNRK